MPNPNSDPKQPTEATTAHAGWLTRAQVAAELGYRSIFPIRGVDLFVEELGKLINASSEGQTEIEGALRASLARVEHDADGLATRLFPFVCGDSHEPKVIVVDPRLSFGRPVVAKTGVPVSVIVGRYRAGEDVAAIAKDYDISVAQTHDAIRTAIPAAA